MFLPFGTSEGDTRLNQMSDGCHAPPSRTNQYDVAFTDNCFKKFHVCVYCSFFLGGKGIIGGGGRYIYIYIGDGHIIRFFFIINDSKLVVVFTMTINFDTFSSYSEFFKLRLHCSFKYKYMNRSHVVASHKLIN